jgi:hypothetical protein
MHYILPALLFAAFAALVLISPHVQPLRVRSRAGLVHGRLRARFGFADGSKASWAGVRATGWPPFHYGTHRETDGELLGTVDGYPVRVAGYECMTVGVRHRYGLACILLPGPVEWAEARGEPVHSAARVPEHIPDGRRAGAVPEFDRAYQVYAEEPEAVALVTDRSTASTMMSAPERFNWRSLDAEVLLWSRDGWTSAEALIASVRAVLKVLDPVLVGGRAS